MLEAGIKGEQSVEVVYENTATAVGSSVGTQVTISHVAATPIGMTVRCETELTEVDGRRLVFKVAAYDEAGLIGEGTHERFIVQNEKFQTKANNKLAK